MYLIRKLLAVTCANVCKIVSIQVKIKNSLKWLRKADVSITHVIFCVRVCVCVCACVGVCVRFHHSCNILLLMILMVVY